MSISAVCDSRNTGVMHIDEVLRGLEKPGKNKIGLAKALGVDPAAITRLIQGRRQIKVGEVQVIRDYFKDEPEPTPPSESEQPRDLRLREAVTRPTD